MSPRHTLLTIADGRLHEQMAEITLPTFERYAERHGYALQVLDPVPGLDGEASKSVRLREALEDYDVALWVDVDAPLSSDAPDVTRYLVDAHAFQALTLIGYNPVGLTEDMRGLRETLLLSIGVWAVARHPWAIRFLDDLQTQIAGAVDDERVARGVTPTAVGVWDLMGFGAIPHVKLAANGLLMYPLGTVLLNERWNSRGFYHEQMGKHLGASISPPQPFIYHATSGPDGILRQDPELRLWALRQFVDACCS
jgi:hypothetical protein